MRICEMMNRRVERIPPETSLALTARALRDLDVDVLVVIDDEEQVRGIVADRDIVVKAAAEGRDLDEATVDQIMRDDFWRINENEPLDEAARVMRDKQVPQLIVCDDQGRLVGIVSSDQAGHEGGGVAAGSSPEGTN